MKIILEESKVVLLLASFLLIFGGVFSSALQYDYSAVIDCLADPLKPQYNGGIVINPEINEGLKGWTTHGEAKIEQRSTISGNKYMVAHSRKQPYASVSHKIFLDKDKLYTFSAWIQVAGKNTPVTALFKTGDGFEKVGAVEAQVGCWSMLKGGISVASSTPAELYFESNDTSVDIWVDSVSLQPFTNEEWRSHQEQSIQKVRKSNVRLQVVDPNGRPIPNANITIQQNRRRFPLGASINQNIVKNTAYQNWFTQRFTVTTFENEMKWYTTENTQGKEDYSAADSMIAFTSQHKIPVRGHNIFWDDPQYQPWWVKNLSPQSLGPATDKRLYSVVSRYRGRVISWDVNNENLHFNFYESKLGGDITNKFFQKTRQVDKSGMLFMNDYNTIEDGRDSASSPSKYIAKLNQLRASLGNSVIGIGLEGHFHTVNIAYVRSALDTLAATGMPIWITELDVQARPSQAADFEQILRELHAHPGIQGIVIWGGWSQNGQCYQMCLVDPNFKNLATGNVLDKLIHEWGGAAAQGFPATTDDNGYIDVSLFHGDYEVKFVPQGGGVDEVSQQGKSQSFAVDQNSSGQVIKFVSHV